MITELEAILFEKLVVNKCYLQSCSCNKADHHAGKNIVLLLQDSYSLNSIENLGICYGQKLSTVFQFCALTKKV